MIRVKEQRGAIRSTILTYQKQENCSKITSDIENRRLYSEQDTITTPEGRVLHFVYQNGRLVRLRDDFGREVCYEYQENRLSRLSYPDGGMQTYSYDENGYLLSIDRENEVPYIENQYDIKGRVVCQTYPDGMKSHLQYDLEQRKTTIVFDIGRIEAYQYNAKDFVIQANFREGREEYYAYDEWGNLVEKTDRNGDKKGESMMLMVVY